MPPQRRRAQTTCPDSLVVPARAGSRTAHVNLAGSFSRRIGTGRSGRPSPPHPIGLGAQIERRRPTGEGLHTPVPRRGGARAGNSPLRPPGRLSSGTPRSERGAWVGPDDTARPRAPTVAVWDGDRRSPSPRRSRGRTLPDVGAIRRPRESDSPLPCGREDAGHAGRRGDDRGWPLCESARTFSPAARREWASRP